MKRTKKLPFKPETVRQLTGQELHQAAGGAMYNTQYCKGGEGTNDGSIEPTYRDGAYQQPYQQPYYYEGGYYKQY